MNDPAPPAPDHRATLFVHYRENLRKCSLKPIRSRPEFRFVRSHPDRTIDGSGHVLLELDAPPISARDADHPLLLLDSTWRLLPQLRRAVRGDVIPRSLPEGIRTAYPRTGQFEPDPAAGLASIEALFCALWLQGHRDLTLLDGYYQRDAFLARLRETGIEEFIGL